MSMLTRRHSGTREDVSVLTSGKRPVLLATMEVPFDEGEHIQTEISCKFTEESLEREYADAGLELLDVYTDRERLFALSLAGPTCAD